MDINDPSNWALITGSFDTPIVGASPPFQWQGGPAGPLNPHPVNDYLFFAGPENNTTSYNFDGITYIGPPLMGTLQVNWNVLDVGIFIISVLTVWNAQGILATRTFGPTDISGGVLGIPINTNNNAGLNIFLDQPQLTVEEYPAAVNLTFSFIPGPGTGPVTGGDGAAPVANATGFGRRIWRPRDNAVC